MLLRYSMPFLIGNSMFQSRYGQQSKNYVEIDQTLTSRADIIYISNKWRENVGTLALFCQVRVQ